ncbi:MAG: thiamine pyrophosphate-dependent enzyme [Candidatus Peregrinibacteria bacterium]
MPCNPKHCPADLETLAKRKQEYIKFEGDEKLTWCAGCGDYSIQKAMERALVLENLTTQNVAIFFDIGCHGNGSDKIGGYTFHGLHGRVISAAAGACLANPKMKVIAQGGDGGTLSEGINHLVHAVRSNYPMVFILHNNENYGLTIGQASATTRPGQPMNGSPDGVLIPPMNPCHFVLSLNPTFVARTFSGDTKHMTKVLRAALRHNGFAFVEVMQLCPTFNRATTANWFWERIEYVEDLKNYDPTNLAAALEASKDLEKNITMGVLFQDKKSPNFYQRVPSRQSKKTTLVEEVEYHDISKLMKGLE